MPLTLARLQYVLTLVPELRTPFPPVCLVACAQRATCLATKSVHPFALSCAVSLNAARWQARAGRPRQHAPNLRFCRIVCPRWAEGHPAGAQRFPTTLDASTGTLASCVLGHRVNRRRMLSTQLVEGKHGGWALKIGDDILLASDRRLPSFERRAANAEADAATEEELAAAAGVLATAEPARL